MCVCEQEVTGYYSTVTQKVLFLCIATAGCYIRELTSTASIGASSRLGALLRSVLQKLDHKVGLHMAARRLCAKELE